MPSLIENRCAATGRAMFELRKVAKLAAKDLARRGGFKWSVVRCQACKMFHLVKREQPARQP